MASEFDKKLRERLDHASLEELMPDFDTSAEWNRVAGKLDKQKKVRPILWLSHAAALVVGLLLSWVLMKQWNGDRTVAKTEPVIVYKYIDTQAHLPAAAVAPDEPKQESLVAVKPTTTPKKKEEHHTILPPPTLQKTEPVAVQKETETQVAIAEPRKPETPASETIAATKPTHHNVEAVHLLDINNEDKQIMIEGGGIKLQYKDPVARLLSPARLPDNSAGTSDRPVLIRGFFEK